MSVATLRLVTNADVANGGPLPDNWQERQLEVRQRDAYILQHRICTDVTFCVGAHHGETQVRTVTCGTATEQSHMFYYNLEPELI